MNTTKKVALAIGAASVVVAFTFCVGWAFGWNGERGDTFGSMVLIGGLAGGMVFVFTVFAPWDDDFSE